jgi:hypothetical protein
MGLWRIPRWIRLEDEARERKRAQKAAVGFLRPALRLIVCGDSTDRTLVCGSLDRIAGSRPIDRLLVPDDPGAAQLAAAWADGRRVECIEFKTEWESFGAKRDRCATPLSFARGPAASLYSEAAPMKSSTLLAATACRLGFHNPE